MMKYKNYLPFIDSILLILALILSFTIRLEYWYFPDNDFIWIVYGSPFIAIPIFKIFGVYLHILNFFNYKTFFLIIKSSLLYTLVLSLLVLILQPDSGSRGFLTMPRSVFFINFILSVVLISSYRFFLTIYSKQYSLWFRNNLKKSELNPNFKKIYIYGVESDSIHLMEAFQNFKNYKVIGIVTDLNEYFGKFIMGFPIYPLNGIDQQIKLDNAYEILVPESVISDNQEVIDKLRLTSLSTRVIPHIDQLDSSKKMKERLKNLNNFELLGRKSAPIDKPTIEKHINDKSIMVTGAGGTIGSELCQQILSFHPKILILFEMSEVLLYESYQKLLPFLDSDNLNNIRVIPLLGSVNNKDRLIRVINRYKVNIIYHAAAYKHVPMVEHNIIEGVSNNVFGTLSCAQAAIECKVQEFILVSTDKAVRPSSVMGATKRVSELILQTLASEQNISKFCIVRFGNVLDSSGSVVPLFRKQINAGGPVTVTDKKMIRYFMLVQEAVGLIMQAGIMGEGGEVFVLDMGEPVKIDSLAKSMIKLSGKELKDDSNPTGNIEIKYIGLRPGEKLYEELVIGDSLSKTSHQLIMFSNEEKLNNEELYRILELLKTACQNYDFNEALNLLTKAVGNYSPHNKIVDYDKE
jgi:UDP-N-acetylglucosamine 4,6-dehydratase